MELLVVNAVHWLYYDQVVVFLFVFLDHLFHRCKVLLVTQINVVQQRTFAWQETASDLKTLCVPVLALLLLLLKVALRIFLHLQDEPYLGGVAEV